MAAKEKLIQVIPFMVHLICECGEEMLYRGQVLTVYPPQFVHTCPGCGAKAQPTQPYPYVTYQEAPVEEPPKGESNG